MITHSGCNSAPFCQNARNYLLFIKIANDLISLYPSFVDLRDSGETAHGVLKYGGC